MFRESIALLLLAERRFEIVGRSASVDEALRLVAATPVDVVLLDYDLGSEKGTTFLLKVKELAFTGKVLVVTAGVDDQEGAELIRLGIAGMVRKDVSPALLAQSIQDVHEGKEHFEPGYLRAVLAGLTSPTRSPARKRLTERERDVLQLVFGGLANKEIAGRLGISESSVKAALQQLFAKTGVRTRSQLVRVALENYKDQLE